MAHSAVVLAGVAPGVCSRMCRRAVAALLSRVWRADGVVNRPEDTPLSDDLAAVAGAVGGSLATMWHAVPFLEMPAFYWRPHPDVGCYAGEVIALRESTPSVALAALIAAALSGDVRTQRQLRTFGSLVLDFLPGLGWVKSLLEAATGRDPITGDTRSALERVAGVIPMARPLGRLVPTVKMVRLELIEVTGVLG